MPFTIQTLALFRRISLIIIGLLFISAPIRAQSAPDAHAEDRAAIMQLLTNQQDEWNKGNIDAFMTAYWNSPDLTFSGASGTQRGFEAVRARYKKAYPD